MYNLRACFYDPGIGRFTTRDAFTGINSDPQSLHKYAYCHCDPVNWSDPSGSAALIGQMFTQGAVSVLINAAVGGVVNATLSYVVCGEKSLEQIMFNFGIGGLLGVFGGVTAGVIRKATLSIGKKLGWQFTARLLYVAGTASINAFYTTVATAIQLRYVENKPLTWADFFELYEYNLLINLLFGGFFEPIKYYADEAKVYLQLRVYMQKHKHLPDGWQNWSRTAREQFLKEVKILSGFADERSAQGIILNVSEEISKWLSEEDAQELVLGN